jgi:hypothetical protein
MNLYRIKWLIPQNSTTGCTEDITKFVTDLVSNKTHYFLFLRIEVKFQYIEITGYSLGSLCSLDNDCILWIYLFNTIDTFLQKVFNNYINQVKSKSQNILYINCFGRFMSTYIK